MTKEELAAIVKEATDATAKQVTEAFSAQLKVVTDQQAEIVKNQGILADTFKALPPATASKDDKGADKPKYLTAEEAEALATKKAEELIGKKFGELQASDAVKAAQAKVLKAHKLDGVQADLPEFLAGIPNTADEAKLAEWAKGTVTRVNAVIPGKIAADVGGAGKEGGTPAGKGAAAAEAKPGGFLKMATAQTAAA